MADSGLVKKELDGMYGGIAEDPPGISDVMYGG